MILCSKQLCLTAMLAIVFVGCARSQSRQQAALAKQQNAAQPASPELRLTDHYEWVKRLKVRPPVAAIQQTAGNSAATTVLPIPLPYSVAATGISYSLRVDNQTQLVWLQSHGYGGQIQSVDGPWKLDQPDAAHLLHSITNPPTNPSARQ